MAEEELRISETINLADLTMENDASRDDPHRRIEKQLMPGLGLLR